MGIMGINIFFILAIVPNPSDDVAFTESGLLDVVGRPISTQSRTWRDKKDEMR